MLESPTIIIMTRPIFSSKPSLQKRSDLVVSAFNRLWEGLFTSPIHLDSSLSKQSKSLKTILAQLTPPILQRPASLAEALGIGIPVDEPWNLPHDQLKQWRPASLMAERLYERMSEGALLSHSVPEDFPPKMLEEWAASWGRERAFELAKTLAQEAPLCLRASRRIGAKTLLRELTEKSNLPVKATLSTLSPVGIRLSGYAPVMNTPTFQKGHFEIQDEGSQIMALFCLWPELFTDLLQTTPGETRVHHATSFEFPPTPPSITIVDACAGAGGKTLAIADALQGKGRVYAYDRSARKLQSLRQRATRAGLNNIQTVTVDETQQDELVSSQFSQFSKTANIVLVDAPCSGWGVLRRNPDIKWRQTDEVLNRMPVLQSELLKKYADLTAPGGRLVYGVCTFRKAETLDIVKQFLANHAHFEPETGGFLGPSPSDGFFIQSFIRRRS